MGWGESERGKEELELYFESEKISDDDCTADTNLGDTLWLGRL